MTGVPVTIEGVDPELLTKQRVHLIALMDTDTPTTPDYEVLEGVLNLLDHISDRLEEFGHLSDDDRQRWWNEASLACGYPALDRSGEAVLPDQDFRWIDGNGESLQATHWAWQTGDVWKAVPEWEHDAWWDGADEADLRERPDDWWRPIEDVPTWGTLRFLNADDLAEEVLLGPRPLQDLHEIEKGLRK